MRVIGIDIGFERGPARVVEAIHHVTDWAEALAVPIPDRIGAVVIGDVLAILELGKEGLIEIIQSEPFTEIRVRNAGSGIAEEGN